MNENAKLWVEALRSGDYLQGQGALARKRSNGSIERCCLGVACDLAVKAGVDIEVTDSLTGNGWIRYDNEAMFLPTAVEQWLGMTTGIGYFTIPGQSKTSLADENDNGATFDQIAEYLVKYEDQIFRAI